MEEVSIHHLVPWSVLRLARLLGTQTYGGCVVPIMANADEGLIVLIGALDNSRRGAFPVCVCRGLM